jgi:hypothetical protein
MPDLRTDGWFDDAQVVFNRSHTGHATSRPYRESAHLGGIYLPVQSDGPSISGLYGNSAESRIKLVEKKLH